MRASAATTERQAEQRDHQGGQHVGRRPALRRHAGDGEPPSRTAEDELQRSRPATKTGIALSDDRESRGWLRSTSVPRFSADDHAEADADDDLEHPRRQGERQRDRPPAAIWSATELTGEVEPRSPRKSPPM